MEPEARFVTLDASEIVRREDAFTAYINHTQMAYTRWDVQMVVGRVSISRDKRHNSVEELGVLIMTPAHAKAVLEVLRANVAGYEAEHGEIQIPQETRKNLASAAKPKGRTK